MMRAGLYVKNCPGCKAPFEKRSGCSHMECPFCKTHFCNECHKDFGKHASNKTIYDHLLKDHGIIRIDPDAETGQPGFPQEAMEGDDAFE